MGRSERIRTTALAVLGVAFTVSACTPLREFQAAQSLFLGSAARATPVTSDSTYAATLAREFNGLVPENELKWDTIHPQPNAYNFGPADKLVQFAQDNNMQVRGVPLVWDSQNPAWLTNTTYDRATLSNILAQHIATVVGRYRGRITQWDVVNEPFGPRGGLKRTFWRTTLGQRYMDDAFRMARAADPVARLFLNEHSIEFPGPKADAVYSAVVGMRHRGVPITGVGFQMHATTGAPTKQQLASQVARYSAIGIEVAITEMDVRLPMPATAQALADQARQYRDAFAVCRDSPNCGTFVVWGFSDKYSWIPAAVPGWGSATMMDSGFAFKPAYIQLNDELARR